MSKPFSQACENNKDPILEAITAYFRPGQTILEIGTYTAQHIEYFAERLTGVIWQPSDTPDSMTVVEAGLAGSMNDNILPPMTLDVCQDKWPIGSVDGVFSANTLHIMSADSLPCFFAGVGRILKPRGFLCVYGPFRYKGEFTSESNARFEEWLKSNDPDSGVRDFEKVKSLAEESGLMLVDDHAMPANNQLLVWQKGVMGFPV